MARIIERLSVSNFAGIKHLDLEVRPFTVVIGPQSVGKSITAKLLYFFQSLPRFLLHSGRDLTPLSPDEALLGRFYEFFPSPTYADCTCELTYRLGSTIIRLEHSGEEKKGRRWRIILPETIGEAFAVFRSRRVDAVDEFSEPSDSFAADEQAYRTYRSVLSTLFPRRTFFCRFIPAGRSFYSLVQASMSSFFRQAKLDPFVTEFGILFDGMKQRSYPLPETRTSASIAADALTKQLLSGHYLREGQEDFINVVDGRKLPARLWSSGQQEAQPLAYLLQHYCERPKLARPLFVEEPEAHLFPDSQKTMTELIALAFNAGRPTARMFLTTHSPYILTTINTLLLAGRIYASQPVLTAERDLVNLVPPDRALKPGSVGAFFMNQDGCHSIMAEDTGLIDANAIDDVSDELNNTFEALLDLQHHS